MPHPLAGYSETLKHLSEALQRFRIYALSYEALQRFIEVLSNLTHPSCFRLNHGGVNDMTLVFNGHFPGQPS